MAYDVFNGMTEVSIIEETVRRFCQGLIDKEAATLIESRLPRTLAEAIQSVKEYTCNQKDVYGTSKKVRTVTFENADSPVIRKVEKEDIQKIVQKEMSDFRKLFSDFA